MTKLIIQIPCYNEEQTLGITLAALPRTLAGVDCIEWLVIDDGSSDSTVEVARLAGVNHIVSLPRNQGLARAFMAGLRASVRAGADIIVNTDADNQYNAADLPALIAPILNGRADIVIGARPIHDTEHFSRSKKRLQALGSWVVRVASDTDIPDAPSGFRALTRDAALRLNIFNNYTYTLEMIIQAGRQGMAVVSVPVRTNGETRPSKLIKSIPRYIWRSVGVIVRIFMLYRPLRFFVGLGSMLFTAAFLLGVRWLALFYMGDLRTHLPSLVLAAVLALMGVQLGMFGLLADLLAANRRMLEEVQLRGRRLDAERALAPVGSEVSRMARGAAGATGSDYVSAEQSS